MDLNTSNINQNLILKLFIYIPTYNRPVALRKCLGTLIPQAKKHAENLRIMVNDNDSSDSINDNILSEFDFENLSFRKNPYNIGGNANMNLGFIFAKKDEFLWILGDDDYLCENALDKIFSCKNILDMILLTNVSAPELSSYSIEKSYKEWMSFWVSASIFNMKTYGTYIEDVFHYHNTSYPHVAIQWSAAMHQSIKMMLLPLSGMLERTTSTENKSSSQNYSLAWTGALGLVTLLDKSEGSKFALFWIKLYGINLFLYKNSNPHVFNQSISSILKLSHRVKLNYYKAKMRFYIFLISYKIKNVIMDKDGNVPIINKSLMLKMQKIVIKDNVVFMKQFSESSEKK